MFIASDVSLKLISELRLVMPALERADRNLADQIGRAGTSITLDVAEGSGRTAGDQRRMYEGRCKTRQQRFCRSQVARTAAIRGPRSPRAKMTRAAAEARPCSAGE